MLSDQAVNIRYCYESAGGALPINIRDYVSAAEVFLVRINTCFGLKEVFLLLNILLEKWEKDTYYPDFLSIGTWMWILIFITVRKAFVCSIHVKKRTAETVFCYWFPFVHEGQRKTAVSTTNTNRNYSHKRKTALVIGTKTDGYYKVLWIITREFKFFLGIQRVLGTLIFFFFLFYCKRPSTMWIDLIFQHIYLHLGKERIGDDFHFHFNMKALIFLCLPKTWSALTLLLEVLNTALHIEGAHWQKLQ